MKNNKMLIFVGMGFELVGIILACIYLGKAIDDHYGTKGIGLALLPMIGLVGWIVQIVSLTKGLDADTKDSGQP